MAGWAIRHRPDEANSTSSSPRASPQPPAAIAAPAMLGKDLRERIFTILEFYSAWNRASPSAALDARIHEWQGNLKQFDESDRAPKTGV